MTKKYRPQMVMRDQVESLSDDYYRLIGEIIFQWNCVEYAMFIAAKRMLGINIKPARIAMRSPRPQQLWDMIEELANVNDEELGDWGKIRDNLETGETNRNLLCHANWVDKNGSPAVSNTSGTAKVQHEGAYKRRHYPESLAITPGWLDAALDNAILCRETADRLGEKTRLLAQARQAAALNTPLAGPDPAHIE